MGNKYFSDIIKQQLKHDAPYAWFLLHQAKQSPLFRKKDIQRLEERLEAYVACFILSQKADDSLLPKLNLSDWGAVYVAATVALSCEDDEAFALAVEGVKNQQQAEELRDALCKKSYSEIVDKLQYLIVHENPWVRVAAIETLKSQNVVPDALLMNKLFESESSEVEAALLQLIGDEKLKAYQKEVLERMEHTDENVRFYAVYAGCMLKISEAYRALQHFCFMPNAYLKKALSMLYHVVKEEHIGDLLHEVSTRIPSSRIKAYNLAMAGLPEAIPLLLRQMYRLEDAKYCAEAFSLITGVDIEEEDMSRQMPLSEEEEAIIIQSQKEDEWTAFYEDDLPLPDVKRLEEWWQKHQKDFMSGIRYLSGKPINEANLRYIFEQGNSLESELAILVLRLKYE